MSASHRVDGLYMNLYLFLTFFRSASTFIGKITRGIIHMIMVWDSICYILYNNRSNMKESRHVGPLAKYLPLPANRIAPPCAKSNISSLKAILKHGRVPLAHYINVKPPKSNSPQQPLTYFDKLKAMFNRPQLRTVRQREGQEGCCCPEGEGEEGRKQVEPRMAVQLKEYVEEGKMDAEQARPERPDFRAKDRSLSMNHKSTQKYQLPPRTDTSISNKGRRSNMEDNPLQRTHNKAHTQAQTLESASKKPTSAVVIPRFKPVKHETVNYSKFTCLYISGQLELGVVQLQDVLGCGANASVRLGRDKKSSRQFAVKIYEKYKLIEPAKKKRVLREIEILSKLQHPCVIRIADCFQDKRQIHILFELIPNAATLQDYLRSNAHALPVSLKREIAVRLTQAVSYLHSCGVSHRDIKTDNVMVGEDGAVKLIDFGYATTVVKGETHCGTPNYMAPELFCKKNVYDPFKVDMWALGVLLYYLFEGCYPFRGYNEKELSRNISTGVFSFRKSDPSIQDVICSALRVDPVGRVSADELQSMLEGRECMMCE